LGRAFPPQPGGRIRTYPQNLTLDLAFPDDDAADLFEVQGGLLVAGFVGAFQTDEAGQRGCVASFQPEGGVGGMVPALFPGVVVVGSIQDGVAEDALDLERVPALEDFPGLGLVSGIDPVGGFLDELADQCGDGLENGGAQQYFEIGDEGAAGLGGAEGGDQLLDFFVPGEVEGFGIRRFFLTAVLRSWRDVAETWAMCSSTSVLKRS
jgi:hypothetical protein